MLFRSDNMINKFLYRGLDNPDVYYDETCRRIISSMRMQFATLAAALYEEGDDKRAVEVVDFALERIPDEVVPYDIFNLQMGEVYLNAGEKEKGAELVSLIGDRSLEKLNWCINSTRGNLSGVSYDISREMYNLQLIAKMLVDSGEEELGAFYAQKYIYINEQLRGGRR